MHSETLCEQITSGDVSGCVAFCLVNPQQGGERLGDETSGFEQKGVMQSIGTDFKQTLGFSENVQVQVRKFWIWKNCLARI